MAENQLFTPMTVKTKKVDVKKEGFRLKKFIPSLPGSLQFLVALRMTFLYSSVRVSPSLTSLDSILISISLSDSESLLFKDLFTLQ